MELNIKGSTALVTGAAGGLGGAIVKALAQEGVNVAACDINREALELKEKHETKRDGLIKPYKCDLADTKSIDTALDCIASDFGNVDILVNISGGPPPGSVTDVENDKWKESFNAMICSTFYITSKVLPQMKKAGWGRIITSTSSGVVTPIQNLGMSNSLRSALVGWSKTLANEVGSYGVTANIVVPGRIATDRIKRLNEAKASRDGRSVDAVSRESTNSIPIKRYGLPEEYADVVTFLSSKKSSYINGSLIRVDGGMITSI